MNPLHTLRGTVPGFLVDGQPLHVLHPVHPGNKPGILFKAMRSIASPKGQSKKKSGSHGKTIVVKNAVVIHSRK